MTCKLTIPKRHGSAKPQVRPYEYRTSTSYVARAIDAEAQHENRQIARWGESPFKGYSNPTGAGKVSVTFGHFSDIGV